MASGIELATAWVSIVPSSKGMRQEIAKEFSGVEKDADRTGKAAGKKMGGGMSGAVVGIGKKIFAPLAAAAAAVSVASFFSDAIKGASDLEQSVGGVEAVFKGQAGAIKNTAAAAAQSFGLSKNAYQEMATVLGAMLKNQGLKDFTGQTQNLIGVGADLAAQFGGSTKDAVDALAAAMRGESDPIERYGISLNEAAVKAELAAMGAGKLKGAALEQAKAQARINIIMRQSADAQGAFAREADTFAGKQQRMAAAWENFKTTIGSALLPSMSRLLDVFSNTGARLLELWSSIGGGQGVMDRLRSGVDAVKAGFAALANSPVGRWFADLARQIGGAIGPALGEISATVRGQFLPAVTVVGGALLDAGKAFVRFAQAILGSPVGRFLTELLKGAVLGFVIGVKDLFQGLVRVISGYFQAIAGLITGDWGRVWDGLKTVVGGAVQAVWGLLNVGLMGRVLGMFRGFLGATRTIFGGLGSFILGLVEGIAKGFVEFGGTLGRIAGAVIGPAVKAVGAVFGALKGLADNAVGAVVKVFTDLGGKIKTALATGEGAMASFGRIVLSVWGAVVGAITKAWDVIFGRVLGPMRATLVGVLVAAWNAFGSSVQQVWASVTSAVSGAWTRIAGWFGQLRTWLVSTLASAWTGFRSLVSAVWSAVTGFITSAWSSILSRVFTPLRTWVASTLTGMWNTYRSLVAAVWSAIYTAISTSWSRISSVFSTLRTWVASTLTSVFTTFQRTAGTVWSGVRTAVSTAWDGVSRVFGSLKAGVDQVVAKFTSAKKAITDTWSKLSGAISGPINTAKDWINKNFSDKVNYLLGKVGVSLRVPALARGGVWQGPGQVTKAAGGAVLRGYTPGRDPHRFWSPTGGNLALSGGEAVMVPEWTRAVGPRLVKAMNRIARRGGVDAIRKFLWGTAAGKPSTAFARGGIYRSKFADGGVFDVLKGIAGAAGDVLTGATARVEGLASAVGDVLSDPIGAVKRLGSSILNVLPGRDTFPGAAMYGAMTAALSGVVAKVKDLFTFDLGGGSFGRSGSWPPAVMGRVSPNTAAAVNFVRSTFGISSIGTLGQRKNASDHPQGKALDAMIPNWGGASGIALGNRVASWFVGNPSRFGTKYVIWREKINSGRGWARYTHPLGLRDPNSLHYNHVHVSFLKRGGIVPDGAKLYDQGGMLRKGDIAVHAAAKPDRVLTDAQWKAVMRHLPVPQPGRPGLRGLDGGVHVHGDVYGDPERFARKVTVGLRDELALVNLAGV